MRTLPYLDQQYWDLQSLSGSQRRYCLPSRRNPFWPSQYHIERLGGRLPHKRCLARLRHDGVPSSPCTRQRSRALRLPELRNQHHQHQWPHQNTLNHFASIAANAATIHVTKMLATEIAKMKLYIRVFAIPQEGFSRKLPRARPVRTARAHWMHKSWQAIKESSSRRVGNQHGYGEGGDAHGLLPVPERFTSSHRWRIFGGAWNSMDFIKSFGLVPGSAAAVPTQTTRSKERQTHSDVSST